jgi:hypothetical protein
MIESLGGSQGQFQHVLFIGRYLSTIDQSKSTTNQSAIHYVSLLYDTEMQMAASTIDYKNVNLQKQWRSCVLSNIAPNNEFLEQKRLHCPHKLMMMMMNRLIMVDIYM